MLTSRLLHCLIPPWPLPYFPVICSFPTYTISVHVKHTNYCTYNHARKHKKLEYNDNAALCTAFPLITTLIARDTHFIFPGDMNIYRLFAIITTQLQMKFNS